MTICIIGIALNRQILHALKSEYLLEAGISYSKYIFITIVHILKVEENMLIITKKTNNFFLDCPEFLVGIC